VLRDAGDARDVLDAERGALAMRAQEATELVSLAPARPLRRGRALPRRLSVQRSARVCGARIHGPGGADAALDGS
jgi:hypothetical protein